MEIYLTFLRFPYIFWLGIKRAGHEVQKEMFFDTLKVSINQM